MFDAFSPFTMVVMIVLIGSLAGVINNWIKLQAEQKGSAESNAETDALRREVEALRLRVEVLERLATDKDVRLHEEITRLG